MPLIDAICSKSKHTFTIWQNCDGWAPPSTSYKLSIARLDWLEELTDCLHIWNDKSLHLTQGELLLAWANLGTLVEGWLKLFYCIYYEDYVRDPIERKGKIVEPNDLKFEALKQFSRGKLWSNGSQWDNWVDNIQRKRNSIHAFNNRDIGTACDFQEELEQFNIFIDKIISKLPQFE